MGLSGSNISPGNPVEGTWSPGVPQNRPVPVSQVNAECRPPGEARSPEPVENHHTEAASLCQRLPSE